MFVAFAGRITVVAAGVDNVYLFPGVQADVVHDQMVVRGVLGINIPTHAMRITQAQCVDLVADRAIRDVRERIVVRNEILAIGAKRARRVDAHIVGTNANDLAAECAEHLGTGANCRRATFAHGGVADRNIHHPPVGIVGPRGRVEDDVAHRVDLALCIDPQQLAAEPSKVVLLVFVSVHSIKHDCDGSRCPGHRPTVSLRNSTY